MYCKEGRKMNFCWKCRRGMADCCSFCQDEVKSEEQSTPAYKFTPGDGYKTRGGDAAKIYAVVKDVSGRNLHGAVYKEGFWVLRSWRPDGLWSSEVKGFETQDLMPKKRLVEGWINVWKNGRYGFALGAKVHHTLTAAEEAKEQFLKDWPPHPDANCKTFVKTIHVVEEVEE